MPITCAVDPKNNHMPSSNPPVKDADDEDDMSSLLLLLLLLLLSEEDNTCAVTDKVAKETMYESKLKTSPGGGDSIAYKDLTAGV